MHQPSEKAGNPDSGEPLVQPPGSGNHHGQLRLLGHRQSPVRHRGGDCKQARVRW